jgi:hypothetical protein
VQKVATLQTIWQGPSLFVEVLTSGCVGSGLGAAWPLASRYPIHKRCEQDEYAGAGKDCFL